MLLAELPEVAHAGETGDESRSSDFIGVELGARKHAARTRATVDLSAKS